MEPRTAALLSLGFLLMFAGGSVSSQGPPSFPIRVSVESELSNVRPVSYSSAVLEGGVLLGGLRRLEETQPDFKFTVREDPNYGLFLESVNGVAGNDQDHTYWELLSESSGEYTRLNVGVGCYIPKANEHIVLRFTTWS